MEEWVAQISHRNCVSVSKMTQGELEVSDCTVKSEPIKRDKK